MPALDLSVIKKQLENSAKSFAAIGTDLSKQNKGPVSDLVPEIGQLTNAIPNAIASLARAAKSIGTTIVGTSVSSAAQMEKMVKALVPDVSGVKALADKASAKLKTTPGVNNPALEQSCSKASAEADKVQSVSKATTATIADNNLRAPKQVPAMIAEITKIGKAIGDYANSIGSYIFNPATPPASILTKVPDLSSDQLLENATANKDSAVDFSSGAVSATVYRAAGMVREINTRYSSKANMYDRALAEYSIQNEQYNADAGKTVSELRGTSPKQQEGI